MKQLKDAMKKYDGKYVSVEALSNQEKEDTYGGTASVKKPLKYGSPQDFKVVAPSPMKYGCPDFEIIKIDERP